MKRIETHPENPDARRVRDGPWNEDVLPITTWEDPDRRIVIPLALQNRLNELLPTPLPSVLRWDAEKWLQVCERHERDRSVCEDLTRYLASWAYAGIERKSDNLRVLFQDEDDRWFAVTIGEIQGSLNIVTVFSGSAHRFLQNRLNGLREVLAQEETDQLSMS